MVWSFCKKVHWYKEIFFCQTHQSKKKKKEAIKVVQWLKKDKGKKKMRGYDLKFLTDISNESLTDVSNQTNKLYNVCW